MFEWDVTRHDLGHVPMDDTHREFLRLCRELQEAPVAEWSGRLLLLARHTEIHFETEERWMREARFRPALNTRLSIDACRGTRRQCSKASPGA